MTHSNQQMKFWWSLQHFEVYGYNSQTNKDFAYKNYIAEDYLASVTYLKLLPKN
jgi:hypothetical protein